MFYPKEEGHHCDCSGQGPADTWVIRDGHQMIHEDNAYWATQMSGENKSFKGFCGDPFTLKLGNNYYDSGYELNLDNLSPNMFNNYSNDSWNFNDLLKPADTNYNNSWKPLEIDINKVQPYSYEPLNCSTFSPPLHSTTIDMGIGTAIDRSQYCMNPESLRGW